jgi:hypothetical protein
MQSVNVPTFVPPHPPVTIVSLSAKSDRVCMKNISTELSTNMARLINEYIPSTLLHFGLRLIRMP